MQEPPKRKGLAAAIPVSLYYQYNDKWADWCYSSYSRKQSGPIRPRKETAMTTANFAINGFAATSVAYYLHSEHYETLFSKEKEQSLVKMRSCKIRERRKAV